MTKYYSKHRELQIQIGRKIIKFRPEGAAGVFETDDEKIIKALESNPHFNKDNQGGFFKGSVHSSQTNVVHGTRGALMHEPKEDKNELINLFKEYEKLKAEVLKVNGEFKTDVTDELKAKFNELKMRIYE